MDDWTGGRLFANWFPVLLCCVASIVQPFSEAAEVSLILLALVLMLINYVCYIRPDVRDFEEAADLQEKWQQQRRKAS